MEKGEVRKGKTTEKQKKKREKRKIKKEKNQSQIQPLREGGVRGAGCSQEQGQNDQTIVR